jgi:hypothetical protein
LVVRPQKRRRAVEALLARLREAVAADPARCVFRPGAPNADLVEAEAALGMPLPPDYRAFLGCFDGGFISLCGTRDDPDWDEAAARWNSNSLFGVDQLVAEHRDQQLIWQADLGWVGPWPYLPFCSTAGQEFLVFAPPQGGGRPVLDAFHEVGPTEWGVLFPSFEALLLSYLDGGGRIRTIAGG